VVAPISEPRLRSPSDGAKSTQAVSAPWKTPSVSTSGTRVRSRFTCSRASYINIVDGNSGDSSKDGSNMDNNYSDNNMDDSSDDSKDDSKDDSNSDDNSDNSKDDNSGGNSDDNMVGSNNDGNSKPVGCRSSTPAR
jgi:hypothetical protein